MKRTSSTSFKALKGTSLKNLVEKHGFGIVVVSLNPTYSKFPFRIISEGIKDKESSYLVEYSNGIKIEVLKECNGCDDYTIIKEN